MRVALSLFTWYLACAVLVADARADDFVLAEQGQSMVVVFAPGENQWAGKRFVDRIERYTGVRLPLDTSNNIPVGNHPLVAVGTPQSNPVVAGVLEDDQRVAGLGEQGYILAVGTWQKRRVLVAGGATLEGANNAVSELVSWKLRLTSEGATVNNDLDEIDKPDLKYRILWNWDSRTNWETSIERLHATHYQRYNLNEHGEVGFLNNFKRAIDVFSDHKLNGLIIWGFLRDQHGGLAAGQELSRYARRQNVRILPGVCTEAAYGGFNYLKDSEFNLDYWTTKHPELRYKDSKGNFVAGICPSKPENQEWLRRGAEWFFENLPDAGGMNLENGDWFYCWTEDCVKAKSQPETDPNFFWDELVTYKPVVETAQRVRPDAWMIFASYTGFTENSIRGAMDGAVKTGRAVGSATEIVYPPRMLQEMPEGSICQWTLTGMAGPQAWPESAQLPPASFKDHVGYIHQSGAVSGLVNPDKWWAKDPGSGWEDIVEIIQFVCSRMKTTGMAGLVMYGERAAVSPANELNYVALEYFGWHPDRTYEDFFLDRLTRCYGGEDQARLFINLLQKTTKVVEQIETDQRRAEEIAAAGELDVRQRARWRHLADELARRAALAKEWKDAE